VVVVVGIDQVNLDQEIGSVMDGIRGWMTKMKGN
jgi:hypothetical protein